jgi:hypothetical protein
MGCGGAAPHILNLEIIYGSQCRSGCGSEEKSQCLCWKSNLGLLDQSQICVYVVLYTTLRRVVFLNTHFNVWKQKNS